MKLTIFAVEEGRRDTLRMCAFSDPLPLYASVCILMTPPPPTENVLKERPPSENYKAKMWFSKIERSK